jgi:hypothetical protein
MLSRLLNVRFAANKQVVIIVINLLGLNLPHPLSFFNYYVAMFHLL